jgi:hypothetical protein
VTITNVPSGWVLAGGTQLSDGTWTVQATDPSTLAITTPSTFAGAVVLNVMESWANPDGTTGNATVSDNVEAYAPGSPIFALSGDDHLTGGGGNDLFVFSQPIGHDTIDNFNVATDKIDLIDFAGTTTFVDIQANIADDAGGNAVVTVGSGETITLHGIDAAALTAGNFVFNQEPVTENPGTMTIGDGAMLPLSGTIDNTGTIALSSTGDETDLQLIEHGITLEGGGQVTLSDSGQNVISGTATDVTLTNVDNTISGAGEFGAGQMGLVNEGTIIATGTNALDIDTGTNVVENSGTLEATGAGGLTVQSDVANSGLLWANGGNLAVNGNVTGSGAAKIDGAATLEFAAAASANTTFDFAAAGTLKLDHSADFTGTVSGFGAGDHLDLLDLVFANGATMSYATNQDGTGGTLSVSDGAHTANIVVLGQYDPAGFQQEADNGLGTLITYQPPQHV